MAEQRKTAPRETSARTMAATCARCGGPAAGGLHLDQLESDVMICQVCLYEVLMMSHQGTRPKQKAGASAAPKAPDEVHV